MKTAKTMAAFLAFLMLMTACTSGAATPTAVQTPVAPTYDGTTNIVLSDSGISVDGVPAVTDSTASVYIANDIVYYETGKDFTYGEGSESDAHTPEEASAHTVVHITKPGVYRLSGNLSLGQIAVDLGDGAKKDPNAVVTLVLDGVDITCRVAPAVIFYNVYECGSDDVETASGDVDTSAAGANVIIPDGTVNTVSGSYVARIYKPDSVILSEDKTEVEDAEKLHKYDAAFYSRRSMNIFGGKENTGILNIKAENEGLGSELHLTLNGGDIRIRSGNDGINTNEDGVSVTTVNGGKLTIQVTGETGEGDGIDSNGWLVINGGTVIAEACSNSADAGIDSDMGIHINAGTVIATGHMLDRIENGGQNYAVFNFAQKQNGGGTVSMKASNGETILEATPENVYSVMIFSSADLKAGTYTLWSGEQQLAGSSGGMMGGSGMGTNEMVPPEFADNMQPPEEGQQPPDGFAPPEEGQQPPEGFEPPQDGQPPEDGDRSPMPDGDRSGMPQGDGQALTIAFSVRDGGNMFAAVQPVA